MIKSQNGWPASADRNAIHVKNYIIPGAKRHLSCAKAVAPILVGFAAWFHKYIEPIDKGEIYDDFGYATPKLIPGSNVYSNHASGTAVDLNSSIHIWHKKGTFKPVKVVKLHLLLRKYGLRWGGDYKYSTDEMHFEIVENAAQVKARIIKMKLPTPKEGTVK